VVINAAPKTIYDALTDAQQFQKIELISSANSPLQIEKKPAQIDATPGGAFSIFGGYITGWQLELVPDQRIVQAWRVGNWRPGIWSVAKFELVAQGSTTKIVFDHTGFPAGDGASLADGWKSHYWGPLQKMSELTRE
jgi:activator of HSP90 ATPase